MSSSVWFPAKRQANRMSACSLNDDYNDLRMATIENLRETYKLENLRELQNLRDTKLARYKTCGKQNLRDTKLARFAKSAVNT